MKEFFKIPILLLVFSQLVSCNDDDIPNPSITIMDDKIECENCNEFGSIIEADGNDLVVAGDKTVYIFEWQNQELNLTKTIDFDIRSGIWDVLIHDGLLIFSHPDADGTGIVYIYEKTINDWDKIQELTIGRKQDNFGNAIDMSANYLVIGADAPYIDAYNNWENKDEGRIYIYKKTGSEWTLDKEFKSQNSYGNDRFGSSIAIQGNYILAGSCCVPTHVYHFDGEWKFLRTEPINNGKIIHHDNNFLATNTMSYDSAIFAFTLKEDGDFEYSTISFDYSEHERSDHGEILDIYETKSIFSLEMENYCFTMEYLNNEWSNITKTDPEDNECWVMLGIELTEDKIYMGGESKEGWKDIVYILNY